MRGSQLLQAVPPEPGQEITEKKSGGIKEHSSNIGCGSRTALTPETLCRSH